MNARRAIPLAGLAVVTCFGAMAPASAQTYPSRPITIVVPYVPGGTTDAAARFVAEPMAATLGLHKIAAPAAQSDDRAIDHVGSSARRRDGRTASITAALSLSGPCNAIAARSRAD